MRSPFTFSVVIAWALATPAAGNERILGDSCNLEIVGGSTAAAFLDFDKELRAALSKQDPAALALLVHFPLRLNHGGAYTTSLDDAAALQARLGEAFPPGIRSAVLNQKPGTNFCNWQGILYGRGELWVQAFGHEGRVRYRVATINLPEPANRGSDHAPRVLLACDSGDRRVVIDAKPGRPPRLRSWTRPRAATEAPDLEIASGTAQAEGTGSCARAIWTFRAGETSFVASQLGCTDGSEPDGAVGTIEVRTGDEDGPWAWCW